MVVENQQCYNFGQNQIKIKEVSLAAAVILKLVHVKQQLFNVHPF
jgi:hypothetical protein